MRDNTPPPHLLDAHLVDQPPHGVERAPRLERPDALQVLAFEEEADFRFRRCVLFCEPGQRRGRVLRGRRERAERRARQQRGAVDVRLDEGVRVLDVGGSERHLCLSPFLSLSLFLLVAYVFLVT